MYDFDGLVPLLQKPKPKANWYNITTPYENEVWLSIIPTVVLVAAILGLCNRLNSPQSRFEWSLHLTDAVNAMAGRPMQGPGFMAAHLNKNARPLSYEVFLITYALCCLVLSAAYESGLKSHLTAKVHPDPIKSLSEFAEAEFKDIVYITAEPEEIIYVFKTSPFEGIKSLPENREIRGNLNANFLDFFLEVLDGHSLIASKILFDYNIHTQLTKKDGSTDVQIVPHYVTTYPIAVHLGKMNRFTGYINRRLSQWHEAGLFYIHMKWEISRAESVPLETKDDDEFDGDNHSASFHSLHLTMFRLILVFYSFGMSVAAICFILEILRKRQFQPNTKLPVANASFT